jgi:transcriptional regulator with XRE-family HTH domain
MGFGERLVKMREARGLSQATLAKRLGMQPQALARYETQGKNPSFDVLRRLTEVFSNGMDWLIGGNGERSIGRQIARNIREYRGRLGLTQRELAEQARIELDVLKNYERGESEPDFTVLSSIADVLFPEAERFYSDDSYFDEGINYLTGSQNNTMLIKDENYDGDFEYNDSDEESESNSATTQIVASEIKEDQVSIPFFPETYAAASDGVINYDNGVAAMTFSAEFLRGRLGIQQHKNLHIITAVGDSMEPLINSGELLFVLPLENEGGSIKNGGVYVISIAGDVVVKRVERDQSKSLTLYSDNRKYKNRTLSGSDLDDCRVIGRVVGHFDRI